MRTTKVTKAVGKASKAKSKSKSVDEQLVEHLQAAEEHLIAALKLFLNQKPPTRRAGYEDRLERLQEGVTALLREELVRIRGPLRPKKGK